ncbi:sodium-coupled monocarboxylate transporter 2-like isoform X2 [Patiria miniata]|nr:sodium-coupled monocarboxylate transporter 2-like isoform X2 [Patiria miniata]
MVMYMGIVIYTPALALNAVTNISLWGSVLATGLVCTVYTTVGGMKAVLWTDVFQMCVMMAGFLAIIIAGSMRLGGLGVVWQIAEDGGRIDFWNFNFDPTIRHTFWSIVIGGCFTWSTTYAVNQSQVQRYLTTGSVKRARISMFLAAAGMVIVVSAACLSGLVMYSYYADKQCDPYTSNKIQQTDQLIPYFMMELFGTIPGLPGFFTSAVFSAALSTVSSGLNALAAVTAEDLVKPCFPRMRQERYTLVTKLIACGFGLLCILIAYVTSLLNQGVLQYLELRFSKAVRVCATFTVFLNMVIYMGIVIYTPALALNAVTDINLWGSVLATGLVCTVYTTVGGMKAVLWTDVFQMCVMMAGFLAIIIAGSMRLGGLGAVWQIAEDGGRIDFWNFNFDPTIRHTFWSILIGGCFTWCTTYAVNQSQVQRYMTTGSVKRARISLGLAGAGMVIVASAACLSGLVMYSYYADKQCDPYTSNKIQQTDQLIPFFMMELFGTIPGLPGFFTSAVFSAALSTVSSGLNALAAVTAEDLVKPCFPRMRQERYTLVTKLIAFGFGLLCILIAYVTSLLNQGVLQLALSLFGMTGGPLLGLFSLGLFFPWTNSKGAIAGLLSGLGIAFWIGIGAIIYPPGASRPPLTIEGCNLTVTTPSSLLMTTTQAPEIPAMAEMYTLSYTWYACAFWVVTVFVGLFVSFLTGATKRRDIDPVLRQHCVDGLYCCLPEVIKKPLRCGDEKVIYKEKDEEAEMIEIKEVKPGLTNHNFDNDEVAI